MIEFKFKHEESGEVRSVILSEAQVREELTDFALENLTCDCEPVGETNVIECGCESYLDEFYLVEE